jgi:hypothetical protein
MPKLVFSVLADGLLVDVSIGLDGATTAAQFATGQPLTAPIITRGEIDTGCNVTAVSSAILRRLGVPIQFQSTTHSCSTARPGYSAWNSERLFRGPGQALPSGRCSLRRAFRETNPTLRPE